MLLKTNSEKGKGVQPICLALRDFMRGQYLKKDRGLKNNAANGQYFMYDDGQRHPQNSQIAELFSQAFTLLPY